MSATRTPRTVVVGGATASGKSAFAVRVAEALGGEIVGADSRQLYAGTAIAAAGPSDDERARVPHHLYGCLDPATTTLSAGMFLTLADAAVEDIHARGRVAVVVGGTGLYLRALRLGLDEHLPSDPALRARLEEELARDGLPALVDRLRHVDPDAADAVDTKNPVRVLRALELSLLGADPGGRDVAALLARAPRDRFADAAFLLIEVPPAELGPRIEARTRAMFEAGIVDEARALAARLPADHALLRTIGVAEALDVDRGVLRVDTAIERVCARTRQYARRQRTWFRKEPWWTRLSAEAAWAFP